ncbi:MAG: hypothetical protein ABI700_07880 [Chloroflexota bacterium]
MSIVALCLLLLFICLRLGSRVIVQSDAQTYVNFTMSNYVLHLNDWSVIQAGRDPVPYKNLVYVRN